MRVVPLEDEWLFPTLSQAAASCLTVQGLILPLTRAAKAVRWVLRNSLVGSLSAWIFAEVMASGTWLMTGRDPSRQSQQEFHAASSFWFALVFSIFLQGIAVVRLLPVIYVDKKSSPPLLRKIGRILWLLALRGAWLHISLGVGFNVLLYVMANHKQPRLLLYPSTVVMIHMSATINAITINLNMEQSIPVDSLITGAARKPIMVQITPAGIEHPIRPSHPSFFKSLTRAWRKSLPLLFVCLFAIGYVHATSSIMLDISNSEGKASRIPSRSQYIMFVLGSIALKFGLQELAKRVLMKRAGQPKQRQAMILIATPTLLVDIQVRIVLLQYSNTASTIAIQGSIGLAVIEIFFRFVKMVLARREAQDVSCWRRKKPSESCRPTREVSVLGISDIPTPSPFLQASALKSKPAIQQHNESIGHFVLKSTRLKTTYAMRILVIHACETYADMYAEYLALGCSYAVLVVFSQNPHFNLYYSSGSTSNTSYWTLFGLQIAIEIAVDVVSSAIEVSLGLEVESIAQHTWSAAGNMMLLTFVNVGLCAGLYISG